MKSIRKFYYLCLGIIGVFALVVQFYLNLKSGVANSIPETIIRYFSYFTLLSNILVASLSLLIFLDAESGKNTNWTNVSIQTAILVVGLVYNLVLRSLWNPVGIQKVVDELLHSVIPLLYLLGWVAYVPKQGLNWKLIPSWLVFPLVYLILVLWRGFYSSFYPYPFLDFNHLTIEEILVNILAVFILFTLLSFIFLGLAKFFPKVIKCKS